jgi:electron transfer flavoprotein beta subunit
VSVKIVVCIKEVAAPEEEVEFTETGDGVDPDYLDRALNEWDSYATEQALRLREAAGEGEVVVVTLGDEDSEEGVRRCLAMGADRAIRIEAGAAVLDPISTARTLAAAVAPEQPDLVLCGVQSSDAVNGATGGALAEFLDMPCVAVVTAVAYDHAGRSATVDRELEGGLVDVTEVRTPALLTIQTGASTPRYVTFRAIKDADRKPLEVVAADVAGEPAWRVRRMFLPPRPDGAQLLEGDPSTIAQRITELVREQLA